MKEKYTIVQSTITTIYNIKIIFIIQIIRMQCNLFYAFLKL